MNKDKYKACRGTKPDKNMSQAFKTAGTLFEIIDSNTVNVIVPYNDDAEKIIARLSSDISPEEYSRQLRKAQRYTVGIYAGTEKKLRTADALFPCGTEITVLDKRFYSREFGVMTEGSEHELLMY